MLFKSMKTITILALCLEIIFMNTSANTKLEANNLAINANKEKIVQAQYKHIDFEFNNYNFKIKNNKLSFEFFSPADNNSLAFAVYGRCKDSTHDFQKLTQLARNNNKGLGNKMLFDMPFKVHDNDVIELMIVSMDASGNISTYTPLKIDPQVLSDYAEVFDKSHHELYAVE